MRVLVVHNRYRSAMPSGENRVVDAEVAMLRDRGIEVDTYLRDSDEIEGFGPVAKAGLAGRPVVSPTDMRELGRRVTEGRADVVHLHNPYPLISPAVLRTARRKGARIVHTVHNYRHICPVATFFRDGHVCEDCRGRQLAWPAVVHGCYRGSRPQSAVMAVTLAVHRPTWRMVDRFLPVSAFVGQYLGDLGIPEDRITVKPNAIDDPGPPEPLGQAFLFAGRLDPEKGPLQLLDAWHASGLGAQGHTLVMAGDGPLRSEVERRVAKTQGARTVGQMDAMGMAALYGQARAVVIPSLWYEGFPMTVVEAFARGRPVLANRIGALGAAVDDTVGWLAEPTVAGLAMALQEAVDPVAAQRRGRAARARFEERYTADVVMTQLIDTYRSLTATEDIA